MAQDDLAVAGEIVDIPDLGKRRRAADFYRYQYDVSKVRCPVCRGLGVPWAGWFHCYTCTAIGWIETGEMFVEV